MGDVFLILHYRMGGLNKWSGVYVRKIDKVLIDRRREVSMVGKEIHSLSEYIEFVEKISPQYSLSRGQEQDKDLLPSILRKDDNGMALYSKANSKSFIDDFKNNSTMYIDNTMIKNQNELLVYAQHFGVPTCLLDFTYTHLI